MTQELKQTATQTRPATDFRALPELGRPGGDKEGKAGSTDIQFFEEISTGARWIGKCGLSAMTKSAYYKATQAHYEAQYKRCCYFDEYREAVALALYQSLGIITPAVAVSLQSPAAVTPETEATQGDMLEYHKPCLHLMTKFVTGFQVLGKPFITAYQQNEDKIKPTTVTTSTGEVLVLKGLGAALAMGCFLHDADCLGGGGANMGYVVQTDTQGKKYAQLVKIDAGTAFFFFLEGDAGIYAHDPRKRNMFFGLQKDFILRYDQLSLSDQLEFAHTARQILQIPQATFKAIIDQGVVAEGFTQKQADRIVQELIARKSTFLNGFAPEVSTQLRAEVQAARQALLTELAAPAVSPVVVHMPANTSQEEHEEEKLSEEESIACLDALEEQGVQNALALEEQRIRGEKPEDKTACRVFQPPAVSAHFTGRTEALASIAQALETRQGSVVTQSISGLGGVGKTQLAAQYAQLASQNAVCDGKPLNYQAMIWLNAERSLDLQFIVLAETWGGLEKAKTEEAIAAVYRYLRDKRTLIVFDNAIDSVSIAPFLPPNKKSHLDRLKGALSARSRRNFHILITSRNPNWGQIPSLTLNGFSSQEAIAFVRTRLPAASEADIQILVDTVSNLPLTLSQAVAYIAEGHCSLQAYPQQFALHQLSLGQAVSAQSAAEQTVLTTFLLTFVRLKQTYPVVVLILNTCAYLAPENISTAWLEEEESILGQFSLEAVQAGLNQLQRYGLLQSSASGKVGMHRILQQVIHHQLTLDQQQAQIKKILRWLVELLSNADKRFVEQERAFIPHLEVVIQQYDQSSSEEGVALAKALASLGSLYFYRLGQPQKSLILLGRALRIQEAHYGPDHYEVALILSILGEAYGALGDMVKQRDLLERALRIDEAHYGPDHYHVASILGILGNAYGALGDVAKKRDLLECALRIDEAHYGPDHYHVASILGVLGNAYGALGDVVKQRDLLERALKIEEAYYGADHYEVAITLANLGVAYGALGDTAKQRDSLERALKILEVHYGPDHYQVAPTLTNLGAAYDALGDTAKQRDLLERALKIKEAHYGADHYQVATTLTNLGIVYGNLGDMAKQRDLLERALEIDEAHYGPDHYELAATLTNLGTAYEALGEKAKGCDLLERALKIKEAHYGLDHYQVAVTLMNLGNVYGALGNTAKRCDLLERTLKILEAHYGPVHHQVAITLANLANAYTILQQRLLGLKTAQRAYCILARGPLYGPKHPLTQQVTQALRTGCGFTLTDLQSASVSVEDDEVEEQNSPVEHKASTASFSFAALLSQRGLLAHHAAQEPQISPEQATFALVAAIDTQRTADWDDDAHLNFAAIIISTLAEGEEAFEALCVSPKEYGIPASLGAFIEAYVAQHAELYVAALLEPFDIELPAETEESCCKKYCSLM